MKFHHIGIATENIDEAVEKLQNDGAFLVKVQPNRQKYSYICIIIICDLSYLKGDIYGANNFSFFSI